ncbi:hypothetical protein DK254_00055 [Pseudomonas sp. RW407]|uniref:hypothetical protein n=1 Tax=Pseudomonas sp. RW407 TaxID=2202894 RepID=UPI000D704DEF|nr:hypothetical protein [Pseudomonas sp. RW407]PWU30683.1 hypothetical protein DK254_11475 [Pseudomonas sp. RW407]PWU32116.1 hypothetical protein DK254_00055 [Pseudomonas sp. RW407]
MSSEPYGRLGNSELALAYELHCSGYDWQHIASGLGVNADWLRKRVRQVEINGLSAPRLPR